MSKQLWVLAGGNGAGKSTFYRLCLQDKNLPFINADILAQQLYPEHSEANSYQAAKIAETLRIRLLRQGRSFCFETVFSHPSKIDFLAQAKTFGYEIILVLIHLDNVMLNQARVAQRMTEGGHSVPEDKIRNRIPRMLDNIKRALPLCNKAYFLDNSRWDEPFQKIAIIDGGVLSKSVDNLPSWAVDLAENYL